MKKELDFEQAVTLLRRGQAVECQTKNGEDITEIVKTEDRLKYLYELSLQGLQLCKIFEMKKELKFEKALELLKQGEPVDCQLSFRADNIETVLTEERLKYLHDLSLNGIQSCRIFKKIPENVGISDDDIEISFDEAYKMAYSGEPVYYQENGEEKVANTATELVKIRKEFEMQGKKLLLYWHE